MKKKMFLALTVLCMLSITAVAQNASFAGTWELDKSKSKIDERMASRLNSQTLTVTQDDKEIKVERKTDMAPPPGGGPGGGAPGGPPPGGGAGPGGGRGMGGGMMGAPNSTYKLDGSEVVTENPRGKVAAKAKLSGGMLEIKSANTMNTPNGEMTMNSTEHWELIEGGKALKIHSVRDGMNGPVETTMVYNKK
jgi:hypothetical protein